MPDSEVSPPHEPIRKESLSWRGLVAFTLLGSVGLFGPDLTPSSYWPDLSHYIPRYILLALSIGFGLHALHSEQREDRMLGIAVLVVGGGVVAYIINECLHIMGR